MGEEEYSLRVFENRVLRTILGPRRVIDESIPAIKTSKLVQNGHFTFPLYLTSGSMFATEEG